MQEKQEKILLSLPLSSREIEKCIPHRYPFLLIDRVIDLEPGKMVKAIKNISLSDPIMQGHFPSQPIYPGVLVVESMAQASAVLAYFTKTQGFKDILLTEVSQSRFRKMVVPGDCLTLTVNLLKTRGHFGWFEGSAFVSDELVANCHFSALVH